MSPVIMRRATFASWVICVVAALASLVFLSMGIGKSTPGDTFVLGGTGGFAFAFAALAFGTVGALISYRLPENRVGWVFSVIGLALGVGNFFYQYADQVLYGSASGLSGGTASAVLQNAFVPPVFGFVAVALMVFPDGRLPSRRWWPAVAIALLGSTFTVAGYILRPGKLDAPFETVINPFGAAGQFALWDNVSTFGWPMMTVGSVLAAAAMRSRLKRSRGLEREQLKWVAFAASIAGLMIVADVVSFFAAAEDGTATINLLRALALGIGFCIIPVAAGVAILRYRLYDIDVVISRTLLVAGLAGFITVTYVAIVVGIGSLVGRGDEPNLILSIAATALVAVAFQPVRRRLHRVANRMVFGRRATPYDVLSGFATQVSVAEASPETLVGLAELMADGTGAQPARVWLRVGSHLRSAASWPIEREAADPSATIEAGTVPDLPDADLAVPVRDQDELLGVLTIAKPRGERVTEVDVHLVERLAAASGVLLRNLRLDAELAERLEEIETSRRRLVSAQDDARRRIEAELGGGTRVQLRTLGDRLSVLARGVDAERTPKSAMLLGQLVTATNCALDTLAGLAAGVYPPRLAADGLVAALSEQAGRAAVRIEVQATGVGRYPAEVEAAVYFAVLEALQNVSKYAAADSVRVRLAHEAGRLSFEVTDDGAGFDTTEMSQGTGLQGIADRLDTVDGAVTIVSEPGVGTTVSGSIPAVDTSTSDDTHHALTGARR
jgi:signal transduction histidine kinase